jgi:hypothetical protein
VPLIILDEWLDIDGTPLATPAWHVAAGGLYPLLQGPDVRGSDREVPAGPPRRYPRRAKITRRSVPLVIFGADDLDGNAHPSTAQGLRINIDYLRANVADPTGVGDGTRTATVHLLGGVTRTGPVHVEGLELGGEDENFVKAVLHLSLPLGALA